MTIAFPRMMPDAGVMQHSFEPQRVDYLSPEAGARLGAVSAGWPLWHLTAGLNNMTPEDADVWRAWLASQRGSQRTFYGLDYSRPLPRWHAKGGRPVPSPTGWSQTIDASGNAILRLTGLPFALVLSYGDYVGFEWGGTKRSLVRAVEPAISDGSGTLNVTVEPPVHAVTPPTATVNLIEPTCLMRIVTSGTQLGEQMYGGLWTAAGGKVEAIQDLQP